MDTNQHFYFETDVGKFDRVVRFDRDAPDGIRHTNYMASEAVVQAWLCDTSAAFYRYEAEARTAMDLVNSTIYLITEAAKGIGICYQQIR